MMELIYVVCSSVQEAKLIGKSLVDERLCACVNIIPGMESIYHWDGKIVEDKEVVLLIKTLKGTFDKISLKVKELHSYDVPSIFSIETLNVDVEYLKWIEASVS